ncbi:MAG TPA: serine/threonine-protein kinase, partial [Verrucomicrobiae bacterium]|nr:serine/threonine-protein kinase [Verrucomicrobiae bacterium]
MEFFTPPGSSAEQEPAASFEPGLTIGGYTILEEVARGGMGVVYRARQAGLDRTVALKTVLVNSRAEPSFQARFRAEAAAAASLNHPGIVGVHEIGEVEGRLYFSMDFIEGETLAELAATNPLPARDAAKLLLQAAEAMEYAHEKGVVHRDLKPSNLIRDKRGRVRITDFGLAKTLSAPEDFTLPGHPIGTPAYMAPEQISGNSSESQLNARAVDIYSLGATLYHLLTGRPPFVGPSLSAVLAQVANAEPVPPRELNPAVPRDLETVCQKCLSKVPERRYGTAADLARDLERFLEGRSICARRAGLAEQGWIWCRRNPGLAASLGASLSLLVAVALMSHLSARHIATLHQETLTNLYSADMLLVSEAVSGNRFGFALDLLDRHLPAKGVPDLRGPEWYFLHRQAADDQAVTLGRHEAQAQRVAFSQDGRFAASAA